MVERRFDVAAYDIADDPGKEGDWTSIECGVPERHLPAVLDGLRRRGYCEMSIDVVDAESGETLPEGEWPQ